MISRTITSVFSFLLLPFSTLAPIWGLIWLSLLTGVGMLMIYRHISNQEKIKATKNKIKAHFLEIRLFKDDMGLTLVAQKNILINNFKYMLLAMKPMVVMLVPIILVLVQLEARYDKRPLMPGEKTLVSIGLDIDPTEGEVVTLEVPEGLVLETPPVRIREKKQVDWRLRAEKAGTYQLQFTVGDNSFSKTLVVTDKTKPINEQVARSSFAETIFQPVERPISRASAVKSIKVSYPPAGMTLAGFPVNWLVGFFIFSIVFGFALKGVFKVEI